MKKICTIMLALLLLLMAGCSADTEPPSGTVEQAPSATDTALRGTIETAAPTEAPTETPAEEAQVSLGRMEGGIYTNSYAGIGCELDSEWTFCTAEELQEMPENISEIFADTDLGGEGFADQITDMKADNVNDLTSINIIYSKMSMSERLICASMTHEEYLDLVLEQEESMIAAYEQAGFQVDSMEKVTVSFLGEDRIALHSSMIMDGIPYFTLQLFDFTAGQYGITITLASYLEDNTSNLLDLFYAVE